MCTVLDSVTWFLKQSGFLTEGKSLEVFLIQAEFEFA